MNEIQPIIESICSAAVWIVALVLLYKVGMRFINYYMPLRKAQKRDTQKNAYADKMAQALNNMKQ